MSEDAKLNLSNLPSDIIRQIITNGLDIADQMKLVSFVFFSDFFLPLA